MTDPKKQSKCPECQLLPRLLCKTIHVDAMHCPSKMCWRSCLQLYLSICRCDPQSPQTTGSLNRIVSALWRNVYPSTSRMMSPGSGAIRDLVAGPNPESNKFKECGLQLRNFRRMANEISISVSAWPITKCVLRVTKRVTKRVFTRAQLIENEIAISSHESCAKIAFFCTVWQLLAPIETPINAGKTGHRKFRFGISSKGSKISFWDFVGRLQNFVLEFRLGA